MKTLSIIASALLLFSFTNLKSSNELLEDACDQSYSIDGGLGCIYNGTTHGWCSQAEFQEYANDVYATDNCNPILTAAHK